MAVAAADGVLVVPREEAERVAELAWDIAKADKRDGAVYMRKWAWSLMKPQSNPKHESVQALHES